MKFIRVMCLLKLLFFSACATAYKVPVVMGPITVAQGVIQAFQHYGDCDPPVIKGSITYPSICKKQ